MRTLGIVTTPEGHRAEALLQPALGRPLLAYTAQAVLSSYRLSRAVLATLSSRVALAGEELGFELHSAGASAAQLRRILSETETTESRPFDAIMILPAIHPLRTRDDIDGVIQLLERTGAEAAATFSRRRGAAASFARIDPEGRVVEETPPDNLQRFFQRDGSITCCRRGLLVDKQTLTSPDCRAWLLPPERCCAVEDDFDHFLLEQLLRFPGRPAA
jgi:CMP-N-acetylneuraminic acid synthetase